MCAALSEKIPRKYFSDFYIQLNIQDSNSSSVSLWYKSCNSVCFLIMLAHLKSIEHEMKNVVIIFWNISLHQVFWLKDNVEINTKDGYYIVSNTGDLLISQTQLRDMGNYTCGAKNLAARRLSESASLIVYGKVSTPMGLMH